MHEMHNPESPIKPYLDMLPRDFSNHPLMWSNELLELTKGTGVDIRVNQSRQSLIAVHKYFTDTIVSKFPDRFPSFTLDDFTWVHLVIQTRTWSIRTEGGIQDIILVPWADMLNHQPGGSLGSLVEFSYFQIPAKDNYTTGEQVFDCYGPKSNLELLMGYGFTLETNPDDFTELSISLTPASGT
jgi:hypothetical protein